MGEKRDAEGVAKVTRSPPSTVGAPGSVIIRKTGERSQAERWIAQLAVAEEAANRPQLQRPRGRET